MNPRKQNIGSGGVRFTCWQMMKNTGHTIIWIEKSTLKDERSLWKKEINFVFEYHKFNTLFPALLRAGKKEIMYIYVFIQQLPQSHHNNGCLMKI